MRCIYCDKEIDEGNLFCPNCGKAVQIVPDYNIYDDDYLNQVLTGENQVRTQTNSGREGKEDTFVQKPQATEPDKKKKEKKKKQIKIIAGVIGIVLVLIFALIILGAAIRSRNTNSYDYQMKQAEKAVEKGDSDHAIEYYKRALELDKDSLDARLKLADIYMNRNDYNAALPLYKEVIRKDKKNRTACKNLIVIYEAKEDTDAIVSLSEVVDESLKDLFVNYMVTPPSFSIPAGVYNEVQTLQLSASKGCEVYYTMDGSDPVAGGNHYTGPITLDQNNKKYRIMAVCVNEHNIYSEVVSKEYTIEIPVPDMPIVTPSGGEFGVQTTVTITVPDGCSAYYTWDGTIPNANSTRYTQPVMIPEGNNILSVVIIDNSTHLCSDIYKGRFVYYEEDYDEPEADEIENNN